MNRGVARSKSGDHEGAVRDFTSLVNLNPADGKAFHNRAFAKHETGKLKEACDDWKQALKLGFSGAKENLEKYCK